MRAVNREEKSGSPMEKNSLPHTIIVRYGGEMAIKRSGHFQQFATRLMGHIRHNLQRRGIGLTLKQTFSHLVLAVDQKRQALSVLSKIFGIGSFSPVELTVPSELDAIIKASAKMVPFIEGKRFAVRAKRTGVVHFKTPDVEKAVGEVLATYGKVDLENPEQTVYVETINQQTYLFCERISGPGGFPLNQRERCLVLISGGFDSAVAAWQIMKRGVACDYLFCNMGGKFHERQALQVAKILNDLWANGFQSTFYSLDFHAVIAAIKEHIPNSYRQVMLKRVMYQVAQKVADRFNNRAIVTGESLGQVTSQSLQNIKAIDQACSLPVFRPLIGQNKEEVINQAYFIGTGLLSEKVVELCGITKGQPVVNAKYQRVLTMAENLNQKFDLHEYIDSHCRQIDLNQVDKHRLQSAYLFTDHFDPQAKIIDCQEPERQKLWSVPNSLHIPFEQLCKSYQSLDKAQKYILYCTFGSKTPYIAEIMQQSGHEAYAFRGGVQKVKRHYLESSSKR